MEISVKKSFFDNSEVGKIDVSSILSSLSGDYKSFIAQYSVKMSKVFDSFKPLASTKTISEVSCRRKKPFKQKGNGRARQGHGAAPMYVGGGVAHGPKAVRANFSINKKETSLIKILALMEKIKSNSLFVFDEMDLPSISTKSLISAIKLSCNITHLSKIAILSTSHSENLIKSSRNLYNLDLCLESNFGTISFISSDFIIISKNSLDSIISKFLYKSCKK